MPELEEPRRFRVITRLSTLDCLLYPDGTVTTVMSGGTARCAFTFDEMVELDWVDAEIVWDPPDWEMAPVRVPVLVQPSLDDLEGA